MRSSLALCLAAWIVVAGAHAAPLVDPLRGPTPITGTTSPPRMGNAVNDDQRIRRSFEQQPPLVPHRIDGYQVDRSFNKCLDCHARDKTAPSRAVPVSSTHHVDRGGKVLDRVSTRRYFCKQCHVVQENAPALVGNTFRPEPFEAASAPTRP